MHKSVATLDSPEFINLQPLDINPLMSKCEIKVLYTGLNRNRSFITKEVASEMAKTLRGAPIVGYYKPEKEDFRDHGEKVIIDEEGIKFENQTIPYGFVAPDAEVWFQKFEDSDELGNTIVREYLMTTGYLWTGQFEECKLAIDEGRPQSMELDNETLEGKWSEDYNSNIEFFIINDAIFSKLCILGEDVEPCFEGSSVTAPEVSSHFTKVDNKFTKTLYSMIDDLKLIYKEGGQIMEKTDENILENQDNSVENSFSKNEENIEDKENTSFACNEEDKKKDFAKEEKEDKPEDNKDDSDKEDSKPEEDKKTSDDKEEEDKSSEEDKEEDKKKYSLLEAEHKELQEKYSLLEAERDELLKFKQGIERQQKEDLIKEFYMLGEDDKKEYVDNIDKYSLSDIEKELSVICRRKKINFTEDNITKENTVKEENVTTYSFDDTDNTPAWINAVKKIRDSKND
jgi:hypothetical protein